MKKVYQTLLAIVLAGTISNMSHAQGCVAVRNMATHRFNFGDEVQKEWQFSLNYRYFRSFRHFKGREEQKDRVVNNTEVINRDHSVLAGIGYKFNNRWSVATVIPVVWIDRSSLYEHDRVNRYVTRSSGIGDVRIMAYYSLDRAHPGNFQAGLGVKLPTGNFNASDVFHTADGPQRRPVDQSAQPGDGGVGAILEFNAMKAWEGPFSVYFNSTYLFNARNTNGTRTFRETLNPLLSNESVMSVPDQYLVRGGVQYRIGGMFFIGTGARLEGIPAEDIIGKSEGFRRPGYILSAEPGISFANGVHFLNLNVPLALVRNRTQSVTDKETQRITGNPRHGDAAFADFLVSFTYAYRLVR